MTQATYANLQYRNSITEFQRDSAERADAAAAKRTIPQTERTSKSGRTRIWCATPTTVTICYVDHSNTNRYRDIRCGG